MKISKKTFDVVGTTEEIKFKEHNPEWSEAFILYNTNNMDDELRMRHKFSYYTVRKWVIKGVENKEIEIK